MITNKITDLDVLLQTLNYVNDAVSITDINDKIIFVNKAFLDLYGYTLDEVTNRTFDFVGSEKNNPELMRSIIQSTIDGGWEGRLYNTTKNKKEILIYLKTFSIKDKDGKLFLVGITEDITADVQKDASLKEAQDRYRNIFLELNDAVYESTMDGKFIEMNPAGVEILGLDSDSDAGKISISEKFYNSPEDRKLFLEKLKSEGSIQNYEIHFTNLKGEAITALNSANLIKKPNGEYIVRGIVRDITELKVTENKLKSLINELEDVNKKLNNLNASKDKFFSIISHDLRSPFSAIFSFSEFLKDDINELTKEETALFAEKIYEAAQNVFALLENLLTWSRIQSGKMKYEPAHFSLNTRVNQIIKLFEHNAENKGIKLVNKMSGNTIAFADEDMISSVLQNLISNSLKFTNAGDEVLITNINYDDRLEISVSDTGIGIKQDDIDRLFRIDINHSTYGTNQEKGSGLGLILCKEMVEKNNGRIWVESEFGKSTSFKITLPRDEIINLSSNDQVS
ncbi:MAG: PAS domain-containing sensor histidine kinase [Melioribacteraceae bacterium]|nr:PAS domain-containing sensor histidine kinase [Melioribacteraceae bacterium]